MTAGEVVTGVGYAVGIGVLYLAAKSRRLATDGIALVALIGATVGILGAKLSELIFTGWPWRVPLLAALDPRSGGRALLGGLMFGWLAVVLAKRRLGIRRSTGDLFALALPAGEAVGRVGCFLNGCCYGTVCDLPWAVDQHGAMRHPAQLYSAVVAALIFGLMLWLQPRLPREGDLFKAYLVAFGVSRFGLEFVRQSDTHWLGLTPMQWFCAELAIYGGLALVLPRRRTAEA